MVCCEVLGTDCEVMDTDCEVLGAVLLGIEH